MLLMRIFVKERAAFSFPFSSREGDAVLLFALTCISLLSLRGTSKTCRALVAFSPSKFGLALPLTPPTYPFQS